MYQDTDATCTWKKCTEMLTTSISSNSEEFSPTEDDEINISQLLLLSFEDIIPIDLKTCIYPLLYNLLRTSIKKWAKVKPQIIGSRLADFLLNVSTLFLALLQRLNDKDINILITDKSIDKYFKLLSYPLIQCFKMSEGKIILEFLSAASKSLAFYCLKTSNFGDQLPTCIGSLLQSAAIYTSKIRHYNTKDSSDHSLLICGAGECLCQCLSKIEFFKLSKSYLPIEQYTKLISFVLESTLIFLDYLVTRQNMHHQSQSVSKCECEIIEKLTKVIFGSFKSFDFISKVKLFEYIRKQLPHYSKSSSATSFGSNELYILTCELLENVACPQALVIEVEECAACLALHDAYKERLFNVLTAGDEAIQSEVLLEVDRGRSHNVRMMQRLLKSLAQLVDKGSATYSGRAGVWALCKVSVEVELALVTQTYVQWQTHSNEQKKMQSELVSQALSDVELWFDNVDNISEAFLPAQPQSLSQSHDLMTSLVTRLPGALLSVELLHRPSLPSSSASCVTYRLLNSIIIQIDNTRKVSIELMTDVVVGNMLVHILSPCFRLLQSVTVKNNKVSDDICSLAASLCALAFHAVSMLSLPTTQAQACSAPIITLLRAVGSCLSMIPVQKLVNPWVTIEMCEQFSFALNNWSTHCDNIAELLIDFMKNLISLLVSKCKAVESGASVVQLLCSGIHFSTIVAVKGDDKLLSCVRHREFIGNMFRDLVSTCVSTILSEKLGEVSDTNTKEPMIHRGAVKSKSANHYRYQQFLESLFPSTLSQSHSRVVRDVFDSHRWSLTSLISSETLHRVLEKPNLQCIAKAAFMAFMSKIEGDACGSESRVSKLQEMYLSMKLYSIVIDQTPMNSEDQNGSNPFPAVASFLDTLCAEVRKNDLLVPDLSPLSLMDGSDKVPKKKKPERTTTTAATHNSKTVVSKQKLCINHNRCPCANTPNTCLVSSTILFRARVSRLICSVHGDGRVHKHVTTSTTTAICGNDTSLIASSSDCLTVMASIVSGMKELVASLIDSNLEHFEFFPWSIVTDAEDLFDVLGHYGCFEQQALVCNHVQDMFKIIRQHDRYWLLYGSLQDFHNNVSEMICLYKMQLINHGLLDKNNISFDISISLDYQKIIELLDLLSVILANDDVDILSDEHRSEVTFQKSHAVSLLEGILSKSNHAISDKIRSWCCLLLAKTCFLAWLDVRNAMSWVQKCLKYCEIRPQKSSSHDCEAAQPHSHQSCKKECLPVNLEALLLLADLYEHCGVADVSLGYLSKATSLAQAAQAAAIGGQREGSDRSVLSALTTLHSIRILSRVGSSRLASTLAYFENYSVSMTDGQLISSIHQAMSKLKSVLTSENIDARKMNLKDLSFRHINRFWDPFYQSLSSQTMPLDCCLPKKLRTKIYQTLHSICLATDISKCNLDIDKEKEKEKVKETRSVLSLLAQVSHPVTVSFDVTRSLRRVAVEEGLRCASADSTAVTAGTSALQSFVLGAGSCGWAIEGEHALKPTDNLSETAKKNFLLVQQACTGDAASLQQVENILQKLSLWLQKQESVPGAICFLTLDSYSSPPRLLIGRYDAVLGPLVCAIPSLEFETLLEEWGEIMEANKEQLRQGGSNTVKLSEAQKRDWWKQRAASDSAVCQLLERVQVALGPWRSLLVHGRQSTTTATSAVVPGTSSNANANASALLEVRKEFDKEVSLKFASCGFVSSAASPSVAPTTTSLPSGKGKTKGKLGTASCITEKPSTVKVSNEVILPQLGDDFWPWICLFLQSLELSYEEKLLGLRTVIESYHLEVMSQVSCTMPSSEGCNGNCNGWAERVAMILTSAYDANMKAFADTNCLPVQGTDKVNDGVRSNKDTPVEDIVNTARAATESPNYTSMKVVELRTLLKSAGLPTVGVKADLINRLLAHSPTSTATHVEANVASKSPPEPRPGSPSRGQPLGSGGRLVLVLCEKLQSLPWESLPVLRGTAASRVPSLALLLTLSAEVTSSTISTTSAAAAARTTRTAVVATVANSENNVDAQGMRAVEDEEMHLEGREVDKHEYEGTITGAEQCCRVLSASKGWFAIDPEGNLPSTRAEMSCFLEPFSSRWSWRGFIGEIPPITVVREYHESSDVFIFCGHGAGERLHDYQRLRRCRYPAAFLWGCSSGRLVTHGVHDPSGPALDYLQGGAPWVIGNLWDVTDKDIDRLSKHCMASVLNTVDGCRRGDDDRDNTTDTDGDTSECTDISKSLQLSRDVCKMRHIVGCAPVVYGLPVPLKS